MTLTAQLRRKARMDELAEPYRRANLDGALEAAFRDGTRVFVGTGIVGGSCVGVITELGAGHVVVSGGSGDTNIPRRRVTRCERAAY
jgi:hypothetical protein